MEVPPSCILPRIENYFQNNISFFCSKSFSEISSSSSESSGLLFLSTFLNFIQIGTISIFFLLEMKYSSKKKHLFRLKDGLQKNVLTALSLWMRSLVILVKAHSDR